MPNQDDGSSPPRTREAASSHELGAGDLYRRCDPDVFAFESTDEVEELRRIVGQPRASRAVEFGTRMEGAGFNIYALGPEETDKHALVEHFVRERAREEPVPPDLCYVNDFEESHRPRALRLPPGVGRRFADDMDELLEELRPALRAAFESEEYQTRRQSVQDEAGEEQEEAFERLREKAREKDLALVRTPQGFVFAPIRDGEVVPPDARDQLSEEEREELQKNVEALEEELQEILRGVPRAQREARERVRELNREVARLTVRDLLEEPREAYTSHGAVLEHLDAVEDDVVDNVGRLVGGDEGGQEGNGQARPPRTGGGPGTADPLRRYRVNVLVDHADAGHAPVLYEDHPTYQNLVGRVEHLPVMGALITDFNLIKSGALHRANGGYLILDARRVLLQPFAWDALKRVLQSGQVKIESPREAYGLVSTVTLEPEPLDVDVKVVLLGERRLYYLLCELDPDFPDLFKVGADFADEMERSAESERLYARLLAGMVREQGLLPFDRTAVARVVERSSRLAGDTGKLSVRTRGIQDLLREASYWAEESDAGTVSAEHVQQAIDEWTFRSDRLRERMQEQILRDTIYIDTRGEAVGQVNGLSVLQLGGFAFGRPSRITARVRMGGGEVTDIEREVELSGPIHSKGVLILQGFLAGRYAEERPLSLSASLVFEQSYGGIEGDSASCAELCTLLSAIGRIPLRQSVAVTGSVNQHGQVQPIGGANEKVEGFYDICEARGLTGDQGVIIPAANVKHLMLREDVREAVEEGRFRVWAVETVDEALEILTGLPAGVPKEDGAYPEGTVDHLVDRRLEELAEARQRYAAAALAGENGAP